MSPDFIEKLILLLSTAALTGFLAPYVLKIIDVRKTHEHKDREALLARQSKIIDAQVELLDTISRLIWEWRYLCMKVTYYGGVVDAQRYQVSRDQYSDNIWGTLNQIRYQISRSRWLISEDAHQQLLKLYQLIVDMDKQLLEVCEIPDTVTRNLNLGDINHQLFFDITADVDTLISNLATEVQIGISKKIGILRIGELL